MADEQEAPSSLLRAATVGDVMSAPLVTCAADVRLREVADLMTRHRIHAVVVLADPVGRHPWGVISEIDLVAAAPFDDPDTPAGRVAASPVIVIAPGESLARAAMLMAEYAITHLVAVGDDGEPVGMVSALDVAGALAPEPAAPAEPVRVEAPGLLRAEPGDRLVIRAHPVRREAEILEVRGPGGTPPFLVRWEGGGRVSLLYPGSDAGVERAGTRR